MYKNYNEMNSVPRSLGVVSSYMKSKRFWLFCILVLFCVYFIWSITAPHDIFWSLDEGGKFIYLRSIQETGRINTSLIYPAKTLDPNLEFIPLYYFIPGDGQIFSWWPIALPLVTLPFYQIFGWIGLFILPALAGAIIAGLTGYLIQRLTGSKKAGVVGFLITGLATPVTFYATRYWEHTLSTALVLVTLVAMLDVIEKEQLWYAILAGLCGSIAVFFRLDTVVLLVGFGLIVLLRKPRQALIIVICGGIVTGLWILLNQWVAGNPFGPTFGKIIETGTFSGIQNNGWKLIPYILFNPPRVDGFIFPHWALVVAMLALLTGCILAPINKLRWISLISFGLTILVCAYVAFQPTCYQAVHGFILAVPAITLSWYYFVNPPIWKRYYHFTTMLITALLFYGLIYIWKAWMGAGGLQWGPRYLLTLYPLLICSAILYIHQQWNLHDNHSWRVGLIVIFSFAVFVGLIINIRGLITSRTLINFYEPGKNLVLSLDAPVVIPWQGYVMDAPELYLSGKVISFQLEDNRRISWEQHLEQLGITHYYYVEPLTVDNAPLETILERLKNHPAGVLVTRVDIQP